MYDANNQILPMFFYHFVGAECLEYWKIVFEAVKSIDGFDAPRPPHNVRSREVHL